MPTTRLDHAAGTLQSHLPDKAWVYLGIFICLVIPLTLRHVHAGLGNLDQGKLYPLGISSMSNEAQAHMVCQLFLYFV